jgi:glycosyltransferase involved in cell wall biosynthesis
MKKKKILFQSDFSLAKTGFGRNAKALLEYLYKTNKYEIIHYCVGINYSNPELERTPWKSVGCLPDSQQELQELNRDPHIARQAGYGAHFLDKVIYENKPDVYLAVQDIWGVDFAIGRKWFNKINSVIWTTLDSLPILPSAIDAAKKTKNYWVWSNFATKALHEKGLNHVKTLHGAIDDKFFYKLLDSQKQSLRQKFNIQDSFVVGFVFRNQLRKSVPNLLEGYALFKKQNPELKNAKLLLHTHFGEGWKIHKLAEEYQIPKSDILTTYVCKNCAQYQVKEFSGQDIKCPYCNDEKGQVTTQPGIGVSEAQLNEIYNLMNVYCHPFTSGGQEIPIQEAKLCELVTLVTNYSCGEEMCEQEAHSLALDYAKYREHETEFIKASTSPNSIAKQLSKVYELNKKNNSILKQMGKSARDWVLKNFSISVIGKKIEDFIDNSPEVEFSFSQEEEQKNPFAEINSSLPDEEWVLSLYKSILKMSDITKEDEGFKYWIQELSRGASRQEIEKFFRTEAMKKNQQNKTHNFEDLLGREGKDKRILYVMPESIGDVFLSTALFKSLKESYPEHNLYVATKPENFEILEGNPSVFKILSYSPVMDNLLWLEGHGKHQGFFKAAFLAHLGTQRILNYIHNGEDRSPIELNYNR